MRPLVALITYVCIAQKLKFAILRHWVKTTYTLGQSQNFCALKRQTLGNFMQELALETQRIFWVQFLEFGNYSSFYLANRQVCL